ncbi:MAG: hypothetical protein HY067_02710 [Betaproteobacteria bacterium]|nr:hypothetical protein [Betaproteobacteria bacterium]
MAEPRIRRMNWMYILARMFKPKLIVRVNALDPMNRDGQFVFENAVPAEDVREFAEEGELYASSTDNWHWVGCIYNDKWYKFIPKAQYDETFKRFRQIDSDAKKRIMEIDIATDSDTYERFSKKLTYDQQHEVAYFLYCGDDLGDETKGALDAIHLDVSTVDGREYVTRALDRFGEGHWRKLAEIKQRQKEKERNTGPNGVFNSEGHFGSNQK